MRITISRPRPRALESDNDRRVRAAHDRLSEGLDRAPERGWPVINCKDDRRTIASAGT